MSVLVTAGMAQAAADEWGRHGTRIRETENGRWHWFCDCGAAGDETDPVDQRTASAEAEQHEFGAAVTAALHAAPAVTLSDVFAYELGHTDGQAEAHKATIIDSRPMWWCPACGNRYSQTAGELIVDCSCGRRLTAITSMLVTRTTP